MQPLEIDSAVFCDGARYTIISRENSSILTCPVASGAGGYTLNRVEGRDIDLELDRLTGHAACIAVDVPTWWRDLPPRRASAPARSPTPRRRPAAPRGPLARARRARRAAAAPRSRGGAPWATLPVREHAFTLRASVPIIRAISALPAPSARRTA